MQPDAPSQNTNDAYESTSYWQESVTHPRLSDDLPAAIDVAIIGGGVIVIGGFCGHGMPFPLRLGQLIAESLHHRQWPPELLPFRLNRETLPQ